MVFTRAPPQAAARLTPAGGITLAVTVRRTRPLPSCLRETLSLSSFGPKRGTWTCWLSWPVKPALSVTTTRRVCEPISLE
jgi:hypothetical protein